MDFLPIHHRGNHNRAFLAWASVDNPPLWSTTHCVKEDEIQLIVRSSPVTVSKWRGQPMCTLCRTLQDTTTLKDDGTLQESGRIEYKDFAELEHVAEDGCLTCRAYRATILYNHPSKNSIELLHMDDDTISIYPKERDGVIVGITVLFPYRTSKRDFDYDPEWPYGRLEPDLEALFGDGGPRERFKLLSRASVDLMFLPGRSSPLVESGSSEPIAAKHSKRKRVLGAMSKIFSGKGSKGSIVTIPWSTEDYMLWIKLADTKSAQEARVENAKHISPDSMTVDETEPLVLVAGNLTPSAKDPQSILAAQSWLLTCLRMHPECGMVHESAFMPKRLIDVGDASGEWVCLCSPESVRASYACLSYCWGSSSQNKYKLLRSNIHQVTKAISLRDMPATLRDAVFLCKALGVRYLWIDALCIIQDDISDWQEQAPLMGDIYRNAIVTIAATSSENADDGLFNSRPAENLRLEPCILFDRTLSRPYPNILAKLRDSPIMRRAWTTQELYLSRRVLHVTDAFLSCECHAAQATEVLPSLPPSALAPIYLYHVIKQSLRSSTDDPRSLYLAWQRFVSDYSSKRMTKETDILIAAGSLAETIHRVTGDEYLAGIWRNNLLDDLMWISDESRCRESQGYSGPTWSWASTHNKLVDQFPERQHTSISHKHKRSAADWIASVDDVQVEYLNGNYKSQAVSGSLKLRGKIAKAECDFDGFWAAHGGEGFFIRVNDWGGVGDPHFDTDDMVSLRYHRRTRATDTQLYCLALTKEDGPTPTYVLGEVSDYKDRMARLGIADGGYVHMDEKEMPKRNRRFSHNDINDIFVKRKDTYSIQQERMQYLRRLKAEGEAVGESSKQESIGSYLKSLWNRNTDDLESKYPLIQQEPRKDAIETFASGFYADLYKKRTLSLDRESFQRWTKTHTRKRYPGKTKEEREQEHLQRQELLVNALILERIKDADLEQADGGTIYRRVGFANIEFRGGPPKWKKFDEWTPEVITIH